LLRKADFVFVLTLLLLAVLALLFGGWLIDEPPIALSRDISPLNPRTFPTIVLIGIVGVAALFIVNRVRGADALWQEHESRESAARGGTKRLIAFLCLVVASALALDTVGYLTTMFVLMAATSLLVGNANLRQVLAISVGLPFVIYVIVTHFLRTALPELDAIESVLAPLLAMLPGI
jgi:hypothetical protein